ncbi:conserved hypothetical protein [Teredinibacter turnerae T7901]|uniref:Lipoprotein n=1 Tax=Teredinibacter turnerae (strain ATCC 39867 / T7901) TaxID=377629 RepID=C5BUA2_TERTT|nr:hypothetical protein [Teredinibacter turnerae]ACR14283.1 conserved hypothetical protein [Teredinibacter turnerae T7901]
MKKLLTIIFFFSVSTMADSFTYDIQEAGYRFDQYDLKGKATMEIFKNAFRGFPWKEQVGNNKGGSEPTISVKNSKTKVDLWVSVIGSPEEFAYLVGIVQPKKVKTMFGFGKEKEVRWVSAYVLEQAKWVEEAFQLYFEGKTETLNSQFSGLPVYLEKEASN